MALSWCSVDEKNGGCHFRSTFIDVLAHTILYVLTSNLCHLPCPAVRVHLHWCGTHMYPVDQELFL